MDADKRHLLVSCSLMIVICFISLFSGASYSDDFLLYLAAIGLAGLYLRPQYPQTMIGLGNILLIIQYLVAPQKAGELGQFILCMVMYNLAGIMFSMVVARGRSYIVESRNRTAEMEKSSNPWQPSTLNLTVTLKQRADVSLILMQPTPRLSCALTN